MAVALAQTKGNNATGANTSLALLWGGNTVTGNTIIVSFADSSNVLNSVTSITDSQSNVYWRIDSYTGTVGGSVNADIELWCAQTIIGGTTPTITIAHSASSVAAIAREYSGLLTPLGPKAHSVNTTNTSVKSNPVTTTRNGDLIIGYCASGVGSTQTFTAGSGFGNETDQKNSTIELSMIDQITTAAFNGAATFTLGTTDTAAVGAAVFRGLPLGTINRLRPAIFKPGIAR